MKLILLISIALSSFFSFADAWDNLTLDEANAVVAELKANPYIFDYCDCCSNDGDYATTIQFLKVIDTEIITCSWDQAFYSVKATSLLLAHVFYSATGPDMKQLSKGASSEYSEFIFMNYTWTFHLETKLAQPYYNTVDYDYYGNDNKPCKSFFTYPTPDQLKTVSKDRGYKKWYRKAMKG